MTAAPRFRPYSEWEKDVLAAQRHRHKAWWRLADLLLEGEACWPDLFMQAVNPALTSLHTVNNTMSLARTFPPETRQWSVSPSHYDTVRTLPANRIAYWLGRSEREHMSREELRDLTAQERTGKAGTNHAGGKSGEAVTEFIVRLNGGVITIPPECSVTLEQNAEYRIVFFAVESEAV